MANVRTILNLTPEAVEVIEKHAPSINKRGQWASQAVIEYARIMAGIGETGADEDGLLERIDNRLARLEKQIAAMTLLLQEQDK